MAQYFLRYYWGSSEVGLYGLGWRFGMVINMLLVHPFRTTWLPFMFSIQKEERARRVYALSLTYFFVVGMFVVLLLSVLAKEIILLAATEGYLEAYRAIPLIAIAYLFFGMYYTVDVGVLLKGKTKYYVVITGIAAIVQLGLNFIFIPKHGMLGAAFSTAVSYFILFLLMYFTAQKLYPIKYEKMRLLKILTAGVFIYTISHLIQIDSIWLSVILKMLLIASFPLLLYVLRFFLQQEIDAVKAQFGRFFYLKRR
jgi:O-antigen/teichoic acid export membrane protein